MKPSDLKKRKIGEPVDFVITGTIEIKDVYKFKDFIEFWNLTPMDDFRDLLDIWAKKDDNVTVKERWYIYPDSMTAVTKGIKLIGFQTVIRNKELVVPTTKAIMDFCKDKGDLEYILSIGFSDMVPKRKFKTLRFYNAESAIISGVYEQTAKKSGILIHCADPDVNEYIDNDLEKLNNYLK